MSRRHSRGLRFSLSTLLIIVTGCAVALWWWQRPYTVESPEQFSEFIDGAIVRVQGRPVRVEGRRVESFRRQLFGDPIKHGPTRVYYKDGVLIAEEWWQDGLRHGLFKRWGGAWSNQPRGQLQIELEFDRGVLVRVNDQIVEDFMGAAGFSGSAGERIQQALEEGSDFAYEGTPLKDVVDDIQLRHDIPFVIDDDVASEKPVSSEITGGPLFALLCSVLAPLDLTCRYRYDVLWVTTRDNDLSKERIPGVDENAHLASQLAVETDVSFLDVPFDDVVRSLSSRLEVRNESKANGPVTVELANISLRSALGIILHKLDLYCEVDGDVLVIRDARP